MAGSRCRPLAHHRLSPLSSPRTRRWLQSGLPADGAHLDGQSANSSAEAAAAAFSVSTHAPNYHTLGKGAVEKGGGGEEEEEEEEEEERGSDSPPSEWTSCETPSQKSEEQGVWRYQNESRLSGA